MKIDGLSIRVVQGESEPVAHNSWIVRLTNQTMFQFVITTHDPGHVVLCLGHQILFEGSIVRDRVYVVARDAHDHVLFFTDRVDAPLHQVSVTWSRRHTPLLCGTHTKKHLAHITLVAMQ